MHRAGLATAYEPLAQNIAQRARSNSSPFIVGLCGPQGSGKSTIARAMQGLLQDRALETVVLALDDLYRTRAEREDLAQRVHPLLRTRGPPGTHDVALGLRVLEALGRNEEVALPSFDKAIDDRRPSSQWPRIKGPALVVLFEGWCVGARPQLPAQLDEPINDLERDLDPDGRWRRYVNAALATEYQPLFARVDLLVLLRPPTFDVVYAWRSEQEQELRQRLEATGGDTSMLMNDSDLRRFIAHYERLTKHILSEMPARADVVIELDADRTPHVVMKDALDLE
jgi:D-glycerate 3-kinase